MVFNGITTGYATSKQDNHSALGCAGHPERRYMDYYKLTITKTARPMGNKYSWETYDHQTKEFDSLDQINHYLKNEYYYCKTIKPSYIDDKNGKPIKSGRIYCFKSDPVSYDDCKHYEQHWVNIYKIHSTPVQF